MFIDTHCHLQFSQYRNDLNLVIERAFKNGIKYIINVGTNYEDSVRSIEIAEKYDNVFTSVGVHPHDSEKMNDYEFDKIMELLNMKKVIAIGEIGLDYFRNYSPREIQKKVFIRFLNLAEEKDFPVIIHNRSATEDIMKVMNEETGGKLKGVMHCFSGDKAIAKEIIERGFYISFTGNITYEKYRNIDVIRSIPIDKILIETDSPFLTPEPKRNERNEPLNVKFIAEKIAQTKSLSVEDVGRITSENACKIFNLKE